MRTFKDGDWIEISRDGYAMIERTLTAEEVAAVKEWLSKKLITVEDCTFEEDRAMMSDLVERLRHPDCVDANCVKCRAADRIEELEAENTRLRAALAMSDRPCAYCSLPADEWSKCAHGFPGCARGDDSLGCPHLGDAYHVKSRIEALEKALGWIDNEMSAILNTWTFENDEGPALQVIRDKARTALKDAAP